MVSAKAGKKGQNLNIYTKKCQYTFDEFINQVKLVFCNKFLIYIIEENKYLYAAIFLSGIST